MSAPTAVIAASAVLNNQIDLRGYPYRYLSVFNSARWRGDAMHELLAAVEVLSQQGFDLVNIFQSTSGQNHAVMCRRSS